MPVEPAEGAGSEAAELSAAPRRLAKRLGLYAGPVLAGLAYTALPEAYRAAGELVSFSPAGRATAAVAIWMGVWWLTEAVAVYVTALLPLVVLPLFGAASMRAAAAPYAHPLIFLFMGGFLIALSMQRWGLHRRLALSALRLAGDQPIRIVGAFMLVTAFLSMWVSNTATSIMLLPVALSVIDRVARPDATDGEGVEAARGDGPVHAFAVALLLGIAYAASIGGMATPIGTPPNVLLLSYMEDHLGHRVSFVRWMAMALPLVAIFLPLTWLLLTRFLYPVRLGPIPGGRSLIRDALRQLGPMSRPERIVLAVFVLASGLWLTRPLLTGLEVAGTRPLAGLSDAGVAMLAALLLFVAPADRRGGSFVLDWDTAVKLPWGILILFGGGLSLAAAIRTNGVDQLLGAQVSGLAGIPPLFAVLAVVTLIVFLTELTSNTATTAALVPVLAALAPALGLDPVLLVVPAALSASCAFMLPVATPPNAVVFGSRLVSVFEMVRAGFWLNWAGIALISLFFYYAGASILAAG